MAVKYRKLYFNSRDNEMVSLQWFVLLYNIHRDRRTGWNVNEGHRTMERQAQLVREKGLWTLSNQTGAASPSATAPHIRTGRPDHALDLDGADVVIAEASNRGVHLYRTIAQEPWHVEANAEQLARYYRKHARKVFREIRRKKRREKNRERAQKLKNRLRRKKNRKKN